MKRKANALTLVAPETSKTSSCQNVKVRVSRRKSISKSVRFEVFKRDAFICQYCGRKSPDVVLSIDHIHPVSKGGYNDPMNYVTACVDCNAGKGARTLTDNAVIDKQRAQLEQLQTRREQLEMMVKWRQELTTLDAHAAQSVAEHWHAKAYGSQVTTDGMAMLRKWLARFTLSEVMQAIETSTVAYLVVFDGMPTQESMNRAWMMIPGICSVNRVSRDKPYMRDLFYIRGILRRRLDLEQNDRDGYAFALLERAHLAGAEISDLQAWAKRAGSWWYWSREMDKWIRELETGDNGADE